MRVIALLLALTFASARTSLSDYHKCSCEDPDALLEATVLASIEEDCPPEDQSGSLKSIPKATTKTMDQLPIDNHHEEVAHEPPPPEIPPPASPPVIVKSVVQKPEEPKKIIEVDNDGDNVVDTVCVCKRASKPSNPVRCSKRGMVFEGDECDKKELTDKGFEVISNPSELARSPTTSESSVAISGTSAHVSTVTSGVAADLKGSLTSSDTKLGADVAAKTFVTIAEQRKEPEVKCSKDVPKPPAATSLSATGATKVSPQVGSALKKGKPISGFVQDNVVVVDNSIVRADDELAVSNVVHVPMETHRSEQGTTFSQTVVVDNIKTARRDYAGEKVGVIPLEDKVASTPSIRAAPPKAWIAVDTIVQQGNRGFTAEADAVQARLEADSLRLKGLESELESMEKELAELSN